MGNFFGVGYFCVLYNFIAQWQWWITKLLNNLQGRPALAGKIVSKCSKLYLLTPPITKVTRPITILIILAVHSPDRFKLKLVFGRLCRSTADPVVGRAPCIEALFLERFPAAGSVGFEVFGVFHISPQVFQLQILVVSSTQLIHAASYIFGLVQFDRAGTAEGFEYGKWNHAHNHWQVFCLGGIHIWRPHWGGSGVSPKEDVVREVAWI